MDTKAKLFNRITKEKIKETIDGIDAIALKYFNDSANEEELSDWKEFSSSLQLLKRLISSFNKR